MAFEPTQTELDRFWAKVQKSEDGCWEWQASKVNGYGAFRAGGCRTAHRFSYKLHCDEIPDGLCVLHKCDNPGCVRPDHLEIGTHKKNMEDAEARARMARGDRHGQAKLTPNKVRLIVAMRREGVRLNDIGRCFGVGYGAVGQIMNGTNWSHVTGIHKQKQIRKYKPKNKAS